jgi:hypothetical protein
MKVIPFFGLILLFLQNQPADMVRVKVNDQIQIMLPKNMLPMTTQEIQGKLLGSRNPIAAYTDMTKQADLVINSSFSRWRADDIELLQQFYKSNILSLYDEVSFAREEIHNIHGRKFVLFEFDSKVLPEESTTLVSRSPVEKYNYIAYTIYNNETYLFSFSCPLKFRDNWKNTAPAIVESIKLK